MALLIGLVVAAAMFLKAEREKRHAQTEAVKCLQTARFLKTMLKGVGPSVALGRDTKMLQEIVDQTAEHVDS